MVIKVVYQRDSSRWELEQKIIKGLELFVGCKLFSTWMKDNNERELVFQMDTSEYQVARKPNLKEFLSKNPCLEFTEYQKKLADVLIKYRAKHFGGGLRAGRTTVVNAVDRYFTSCYPIEAGMSREI